MSEDRWSHWFNRRKTFFGSDFGEINDVFKQMEETIAKEFEELSRRAPEELHREQTLPDGTKVKSFGPFVYGYSVTVGPDGKPKIREFGNFKAQTRLGKPQMEVKDEREPLTDVVDAGETVKVIIELPGVEKDEIKLSGTDDKLTISVETSEHKYFKEVQMPAKIEVKKATSKYKNGVLDVTIPKKKQEQTKTTEIKID